MNKLLFLFACFFSFSSFAWRETGHFSVCEIASRYLKENSPQAYLELKKIFNQDEYATHCTWPDTIRKTKAWGFTYNWHFININDNEVYLNNVSENGDVLTAILLSIKKLSDPKLVHWEKMAMLKFLGHYMGDLHQPLHVGKRDDFGGNAVKVSWFGEETYVYTETSKYKTIRKAKEISLHKIWDLHLPEEYMSRNNIEDDSSYNYIAFTDSIESSSKEQISDWQNSYPLTWVMESLLYREVAYNVGFFNSLDEQYYLENIELMKQRIRQAGFRLGKILEEVLTGQVSSYLLHDKYLLNEILKIEELEKYYDSHKPNYSSGKNR